MTAYDGAILWCVAQAALLAGLGLAADRFFIRQAPASAALVGAAALSSIVLATLLIPTPSLRFSMPAETHRTTATALPPSNEDAIRDSIPESADVGGWLDWRAMGRRLLAVVSAGTATTNESRLPWRTLIVTATLVAAVVGLLRLVTAAAFVIRLRSGRTKIADETILRLSAELQRRLGVRRPVELCESAAVSSPAIVGWRRPIVLLPTDRSGWSEKHLRATLAHELAHAARGDFLWRAAARIAVALHYGQPLVHWLARQFAIAQEAAADRLAAETVGGAAAYARALSELALRLDDHSRLRAEPLVLPALSSQLERRMTMLRSKDGTTARGCRRGTAVVAASCLVFAGLGTTALRGESKASVERDGQSASSQRSDAPFNAPRPNVGFMNLAESKLSVIIQPDELARRKHFAPLVESVQAFLQEQIELALGSKERAPRVRFDAIDYIVYSLRTPSAEEAAAKPVIQSDEWSGLTIDLALRFVEPTDCCAWAAVHLPNAELAEDSGISYVRVKMGDRPEETFYLGQRDSNTAVLTYELGRLRRLLAMDNIEVRPATEYEGLDNGVFAFSIDAKMLASDDLGPLLHMASAVCLFVPRDGSYSMEQHPDPITEAKRAVDEGTRRVTAGIDLDPASDLVSCRVVLACDDNEAAAGVRKSMEFFQQFAKAITEGMEQQTAASVQAAVQSGEATEEEALAGMEAMTYASRLLRDAALSPRSTRSTDDSVMLESSGRYPRLLTTLLRFDIYP